MSETHKNIVLDPNVKQLMDVDKCQDDDYQGQDSGFLSGTNLTSSDDLSAQHPNLDSGVIDLGENDKGDSSGSENSSEDKKQVVEESNGMRFDSGVDLGLGLSETFSDLNLGNGLNDLSGTRNKLASSCAAEVKNCSYPTNPEEITSIFKEPWEYYFEQDEEGDTPLHLGIIHGFVEAVYSLIRLAPHPYLLDIRNDTSLTPLHLAVVTKQSRIARLLIVAGAKPSVKDRRGETALHLACQRGDLAAVKAITAPVQVSEVEALGLRYGGIKHEPVNLEQWNYEGETCVHLAALHDHVEVLRHLVWLGADINAREGKAGYTALHLAIAKKNKRLLNFIVSECPSLQLETRAYSKLTAYQYASDPAVRKMLVSRGAIAIESETEESSMSETDSDSETDMPSPSHRNPQQSTSMPIATA